MRVIRPLRLTVPGMFLFLAGCAVLNIDVDVYKGPLSNHERVQTEQMAAMAMGAKPILAQSPVHAGAERMPAAADAQSAVQPAVQLA